MVRLELVFALALLLAYSVQAEESTATSMDSITVYSDLESAIRVRQDEQTTELNERTSASEAKSYGAHSLADAVKTIQGVDTQTSCANCGAKRISINGLRGEHTTVLVDGVPIHSSVSSFYGMDTVPLSGVEEIQVQRGAGNALTSPEAIGGTINLITRRPNKNSVEVTTQNGIAGTSNYEILASGSGRNNNVLAAIQQSEVKPWDIDNNGIAESPRRQTQNLFVNYSGNLTKKTNVQVRASNAQLNILGGNTTGFEPENFPASQVGSREFVGGDIRQPFIGSDPTLISEWVEVDRSEVALQTTTLLKNNAQLEFRGARVEQNQDSIYSHGYDYKSKDGLWFGDVRYTKLIAQKHLFTVGADTKNQKLSSESEALYELRSNPLDRDNFEFNSRSLYAMNEWDPTDRLSLAVAARLDNLNVTWTDLDTDINETLLAPRFKLKYSHSEHLTSRFAYGVGYRPPLTIFESQHGSNHYGFVTDIKEIETAQSVVYSLSTNHPKWFITAGAQGTRLDNMAYGDDRTEQGLPVRFINSEETFDLWTTDIIIGGIPAAGFDLQVAFENFQFPDEYARRLPSAAIEQRIKIDTVYSRGRYKFGSRLSWVGSRNLTRYGYEDHFNIYNNDPDSEALLGVSDQKNQSAPAFWLFDINANYQISEKYRVSLIVNNVFDFTQTGNGDSPTTWHRHTSQDVHFDNFHTWGPLQGREYILGFNAVF